MLLLPLRHTHTHTAKSLPEPGFAAKSVEFGHDGGVRSVRARSNTSSGRWLTDGIPFYLIGGLLAATAFAKLWMLLTDSFADIRVGLPREILWLSVVFEFWFAYENFRIRDRRVLAFMNTMVFSLLAIFGSMRLWMGYQSCGCSGNLEIPAWIFILLDGLIVAWFLVGRQWRTDFSSGRRELIRWWRGWSPEVRGRLAGLAIFGGAILGLQLPVAAPLRAMALGEPPVRAIVRIDGDLFLDRETVGQVEIWNRSPHSAKIVGLNRSCRCFKINGDPLSKTIRATERITFPLVIKPEKTGPLHQRVVLFLDHPNQFRVHIDVVSSVIGVK